LTALAINPQMSIAQAIAGIAVYEHGVQKLVQIELLQLIEESRRTRASKI